MTPIELVDVRPVVARLEALDARLSKMERRFWVLCVALFAADKIPLEKLLALLAP